MPEIRHYRMFIDGAWCDAEGDARIESVNPADGSVWASFPDASAADVDRAVRAAHRAFAEGPWARMSARERGEALRGLARAIEPLAEALGRAETTDTGKLFRETRWQAGNVVQVYDYYAGMADKLQGDLPPAGPDQPLMMVVREPLGVVAAVVPWNSQLHLAAFKIAPALAAGNTIVVKASDNASAAMLEFAEAVAASGLPEGVINIVTGRGAPCGETLVSHPLVRRVSFTGGVQTARRIIPATAANIAMMSLELGGKSPVVVFDDADLDSTLNGVTAAIFAASGQSCAAGSRLLLQDGVYDAFLDRLAARAATIRVGDPMAPDTDMGPLATAAQRDRIEGLLARAVGAGRGRLVQGGGRPEGLPEGGFYFEPTIVAFPDQSDDLVRTELFGPVLSVMRFRDEAEAVALANDSDHAFAGGVFSADFGRCYRMARAIRAGRVWINSYRSTSVMVPFGGSGHSGYGREGGIDAVRDYTQEKGIFVEVSGQPLPDPFVMR